MPITNDQYRHYIEMTQQNARYQYDPNQFRTTTPQWVTYDDDPFMYNWMPPKPEPIKAVMGEIFFIYGTLKQGHRNSKLLLQEDMRLLDKQALVENFALIELCNGIPAVVYKEGSSIYGELYDMGKQNQKTMENIEIGYTRLDCRIRKGNGEKLYGSIWAWQQDYHPSQLLQGVFQWDKTTENHSLEYGLK